MKRGAWIIIFLVLIISVYSGPPVLPTIFYGRVIDDHNVRLPNVRVTATWVDNTGMERLTETTTLTKVESFKKGSGYYEGFYFFKNDEILAKAGTPIIISAEDSDITIEASPGKEPFEVEEHIVLKRERGFFSRIFDNIENFFKGEPADLPDATKEVDFEGDFPESEGDSEYNNEKSDDDSSNSNGEGKPEEANENDPATKYGDEDDFLLDEDDYTNDPLTEETEYGNDLKESGPTIKKENEPKKRKNNTKKDSLEEKGLPTGPHGEPSFDELKFTDQSGISDTIIQQIQSLIFVITDSFDFLGIIIITILSPLIVIIMLLSIGMILRALYLAIKHLTKTIYYYMSIILDFFVGIVSYIIHGQREHHTISNLKKKLKANISKIPKKPHIKLHSEESLLYALKKLHGTDCTFLSEQRKIFLLNTLSIVPDIFTLKERNPDNFNHYLTTMKIEHLMEHTNKILSKESTCYEALKLMLESRSEFLPIVDDNKVLDIISLKHVFEYVYNAKDIRNIKTQIIPIKKIANHKPITLKHTTHISEAMLKMRKSGKKEVIVDSKGKAIGTFSAHELLKYIINSKNQELTVDQFMNHSIEEINSDADISYAISLLTKYNQLVVISDYKIISMINHMNILETVFKLVNNKIIEHEKHRTT